MAPRYAASFQCLGSACPDTCCRGWTIGVDRPTLERWKRDDMRLGGIPLVAYTEPAAPQETLVGDQSAVMTRNDDGACLCLAEDKWCKVHQALGEAVLPDLCSTFPRRRLQAGDRISHYLSPSCPEVTRLALSRPDALDLVEATTRTGDHRLPATSARRSAGLATTVERESLELDAVDATAEILADTLRQLIRWPSLSVGQALSLFHLTVSQWPLTSADPAVRTATIDGIVAFHQLASMGDPGLVESARLAEATLAPALPLRTMLHRAAAIAALDRPTRSRPHSIDVLAGIAAGFGFDPGEAEQAPEVACAEHQHADQTWFSPFEAAHPHVLKNFMLNRLGAAHFPTARAVGLPDEIAAELLHLHLVRAFLVGRAKARQSAFDLDDCIEVIHAYSRGVAAGFASGGSTRVGSTPQG
jgi:lysine-N-methylase